MPLYYFQVQVAGSDEGPIEGPLELRDVGEAWKEGIRTCGELLRSYDDRFEPGSEISLLVQDEHRETLRAIIVKGSA
jgi:hypothetical protein